MGAPRGNKYAVGNNGGRPLIYETPEKLKRACDNYFEYIKGEKAEDVVIRHPEPPTITGLTLYLGFADRSSLDDYAKRSNEFFHVIKRACKIVEHGYELRLSEDKPVGAIFALKNMGWKDKNEVGFTDNEGNDVTPFLALPTDKLKAIEKLMQADDNADNKEDTPGDQEGTVFAT